MNQDKIKGGIGVKDDESPRVIQVIVSNNKSIGDGTPYNPFRKIFQVFELDGTLLAEHDNDFDKLNRSNNLKKISLGKRSAHDRTVSEILDNVHSHFNSLTLDSLTESIKKSGLSVTDYISRSIKDTKFSMFEEDGE